MSNHVVYMPLHLKNQTINRWLVCGPFEQEMTFTPVTMEGEVNTWLIEGFAIHANPSRKTFVEERLLKTPDYMFDNIQPRPGDIWREQEQKHQWELYFPWNNPRIDRSGFWFVPTQLVSYAVTELKFARKERASFTLYTCGAVTLWVNGQLVTDFVSYERNKMALTEFEFHVNEGMNRFELRFEDLAERDTEYYFQLDYHGEQQPSIILPAGDSQNDEVHKLEQAIEEAYFTKETVIDSDVVLEIINPFSIDLPVDITWGNFLDGYESTHVTFLAGARQLVLGHCDQIGMGYKYLKLDFWLNGLKISRTIGVETHLTKYDLPDARAATVCERKARALLCIAEQGSPNIHTALAKLHVGIDTAQAEQIIRTGIARINRREDCSDFYLVGLFQLWHDFYDRDLFPTSIWEEIKQCILNFRYWIDEPGDDVMWFFSENHALLFHVCELLAGQMFPDDMFSNSQETGRIHLQKAERRLNEWFDRFFEEGLAEWNSNAYMPIDALGLLHLYKLAASKALKEKAKKAMDLLFYYISMNAHEGRMMCTFGRSYEKELKGHYAAGTTSMCWIAYGFGNVNAFSLSNVIYSLSDYEPPAAYVQYLQPDSHGYIFQYEQGQGGYARLYHYKTKDFTMSSIEDFRPGHPGYQEHVLHFAASPAAQLWINHPGERHSYGSGRPSFWAGNGTLPKVVQHKGLAIMLYRLDPEHAVGYTHAFLPLDEYDEWTKVDDWVLARKGEAYVALWSANGMSLIRTGCNRGREWVADGTDNVWIIRAANASEFTEFAQFIKHIEALQVNLDKDMLVNVDDPLYGEVSLGWKRPLLINGESISVKGAGIEGILQPIKQG